MNNRSSNTDAITPQEMLRREQKLLRRSKGKRRLRALDRIFGFLLATLILIGVAGLGLEYVLVKGPSPALSEAFSMTMLETRRFRWVPGIFLTQDEVKALRAEQEAYEEVIYDPSLIEINSEPEPVDEETGVAPNPYGDFDEDGDGIILENITGNGYVGYMIKVLDPTRVFVSKGGSIYPLESQCRASNALGGINAGAFQDDSGTGSGDTPEGLTVIDGQVIYPGFESNCFAGLTREGRLVVGYFTYDDVINMGIVGGVTFGPILVANGQPTNIPKYGSINPRTAIGQRQDGCILMLVIDGRQVHSNGANYSDIQEIMLEYGAVNAINLDGGSSTTMWYNGSYVNSCSSANGVARPIPNAFLFR